MTDANQTEYKKLEDSGAGLTQPPGNTRQDDFSVLKSQIANAGALEEGE